MMRDLLVGSSLLPLLLGLLALVRVPAQGGDVVVHALLFYSPSCTHCQAVMAESISPLKEQYGEQLFILAISSGSQEGQALYEAAVDRFEVPQNRRGVPTLVIDDVVLVGAVEIPDRLPGLIEEGLANGGVGWPDIPRLDQYLANYGLLAAAGEDTTANHQPEAADLAAQTPAAPMTFAPMERFREDLSGNSLAVIVLLGLLISLVTAVGRVARSGPMPRKRWPNWSISLLIMAGLFAALYLSFVEITQSRAVCGPVGHCNTVQQSPYATLFGVIPVGVLGVVGYVAIGCLWLCALYGPADLRPWSIHGLWVLVLLGTVFSIYLTFLEPFVIGASCAWCLSSAVVMALLLWASTARIVYWRSAAGSSSGLTV